jgi:hypothetical protein
MKSRRIGCLVAHMGDKTNAYSVVAGKPEEKRRLGKPRYS